MDLIIVRHARPQADETTSDPPLSELGLRQAQAVAERLAAETIDHLASSTMVRAQQTAQPLADHLGLAVELRDDLREADEHRGRYVPAEEMTADDAFVKEFAEDPMAMFEGGYDAFRDKVVDGFDEIIAANRGRTVAVFCHGMVMGTYLQALLDLEAPYVFQHDYTGICRVSASSTGLRTVRSVNETGHVFGSLARWGTQAG